jgi:integrase
MTRSANTKLTPDLARQPGQRAGHQNGREKVQKMLRHSDVSTTLGIYAHSMSEDRLVAQADMLTAIMTPSNAVN